MIPTNPPSQIEDWFFHPSVRMDMDCTYAGWKPGQWQQIDRDYLLFGGRAAMSSEPEIFNLIHEMAHLIDIDDARAISSNWGLKPGTWTDIGIWAGFEPQSSQCIERELKVFAIQAAIMDHLDLTVDFYEMAELAANGAVPGYFFFRNNVGCTHEDEQHNRFIKSDQPGVKGRFVPLPFPGLAHHVCASVIMSLTETLAIQDIWIEWCRKQDVVSQLFAQELIRKDALNENHAHT